LTTVVLLLLALIWGALLVSWLRSRSASTFSDSVGTFRRHLNVLERTTPVSVRPANRLYEPRARPIAPTYNTARPAAGPGRITRPMAGNAAALRRRQAQKRRRDVFFALLAGAVGALALALVPGLGIMWSVQVLFDILLASYCAILVRLRNMAAEREMKLRYMPSARPPARMRPTYDFGAGYGDLELRRAAN
jgi:hypothetical protein